MLGGCPCFSFNSASLDVDPPDSITITAPVTTSGGNVSLVANNGVTLSGANADVTTGGGTFTVDADSDDNGTGTYSQNDAGSAVVQIKFALIGFVRICRPARHLFIINPH